MKRTDIGGYDAWGVRLPSGLIREFATRENATSYAERMEGSDVVWADGSESTLIGLKVVHRYIPEWTDVDGGEP